MNEEGISYVESLLALVILFTITALIVPIQLHMSQSLEQAKRRVHASETAYNGALLMHYYGDREGFFTINGERYDWVYQHGEICVHYSWKAEMQQLCIER